MHFPSLDRAAMAALALALLPTLGAADGAWTTAFGAADGAHGTVANDTAAGDVWQAAYNAAAAALAKLAQEDKIALVTGVGWLNGPCVGNTAAIASINYPMLCLQDGPLGLRFAPNATAFPPGIQAAATWDANLLYQRGTLMGVEAKAAGVHVKLGPVCGPLMKNPLGGRGYEGFGADSYLAGAAMAATIRAMQGAGVQACAKHLIGNEQEVNRETMDSRIDDRTLHELYLWPFADAVHANVASVMCSYNMVNSTYACESDALLTTLLKEELGFRGYIMSDWNAQHTTDGAANAGLDMSMPGSDFNRANVLWGPQLSAAISAGQVPQARLDDMATRVLASWYLLQQDQGYPATNIVGLAMGRDHMDSVRAVARDGTVLLQNKGNVLPLRKPAKMALFGSAAVVNPEGLNTCLDQGCNIGALGMGWGSGAVNYPYFVAPADALQARATADGTTIQVQATDDTNVAGVAAGADVCLVFVTADSGEEYITVESNKGDRVDLDPWHNGNALVQAVGAACQNTVVVMHSVGPVILETILAAPGVQAVVWAGLPSSESGNALVDILYGATSPNGKLPFTIAVAATDYSSQPVTGTVDNFTEGLYTDYRHFDQAGITPRFEFGFGLCACPKP